MHTFEEVVSSSILHVFTFAWKGLHQSAQLGVLDRSSDSICEQARLDFEVYSWLKPLPVLCDFKGGGALPGIHD